MTWQAEVIDPNGVVPFWLDRIGHRPADAGDFWGVGLEHWRLDPARVERLRQDPIQWPLAFNFNNQLDLVGHDPTQRHRPGPFLACPASPCPKNLTLTLDLTDKDGHDWDQETVVGPPGSYAYPASRWPVGQIVMTRHHLPWQIGTPPGLYRLEIGLGQLEVFRRHQRRPGSRLGHSG